MANVIGAIIFSIVSVICFVLSYFQFSQKGFLFNNAYIYASEKEREAMNKKPYYKQSGTVFIMVALIFLINAVEMIIKTGWLFYLVIDVVIIAVVYAIVSSITIHRNNK